MSEPHVEGPGQSQSVESVHRRLPSPDRLVGLRAYMTQEVVLLGFVLALAIAFGFNTSIFWSGTNLQNLSSQGAVLAMVAAGEIFPILIGGIDLSVGGQISLLSILAVELSHHMSVFPAFVIVVLIGVGIGLLNGLLVTFARVSPIIATLGTWQVLAGFALWYTKGLPVTNYGGSYTILGNHNISFLPYATALALIVVVVAWVILARRMRFGRHVYALGGNFEAARLSGVRTLLTTMGAYAMCATFTAVGAVASPHACSRGTRPSERASRSRRSRPCSSVASRGVVGPVPCSALCSA